MKFRQGQKVCCVHAPTCPLYPGWRAYPKRGEVYTVRAYRPDEPHSLMLYEIVNDIGTAGYEAAFFEDRFRPVVTRKTDISCFETMLNKTPEVVR